MMRQNKARLAPRRNASPRRERKIFVVQSYETIRTTFTIIVARSRTKAKYLVAIAVLARTSRSSTDDNIRQNKLNGQGYKKTRLAARRNASLGRERESKIA